MNLYSIDFTHYAPKGSEEGIFCYMIANNDEEVYEWIKSEPNTINGKTIFNPWGYYEDDNHDFNIYDDDYEVVGTEKFRDRAIRMHGELYDDDAEVSDLYYGATLIGWSLVKENVTDEEIDVLESLEII